MRGNDATPEDVPIEVPAGDAAEQLQSGTAEPEAPETPSGTPPLETNPADWQEQQLIVEDPDGDEHR